MMCFTCTADWAIDKNKALEGARIQAQKIANKTGITQAIIKRGEEIIITNFELDFSGSQTKDKLLDLIPSDL